MKNKSSIQEGKKLIYTFFSVLGVATILIIINYVTSPGTWWVKYPLIFLSIGFMFQIFQYAGSVVAEKFEEKQIEKKKVKEEELELRELEKVEKRRGDSWNEEDFV